jgi:diaminopimelate decarboxylase
MAMCLTRNGRGYLQIEGIDVSFLSKNFGTPLFVICENHLRENYRNFRDLFLSYYPKTIIAYSYKTNYLPFICKIIKEVGSWAEVTSSLELNLARKIGHDPKKTIFNGPAKTYRELLEAMKFGVKIINIDSLSELKKIILLSKKYKLKSGIGLRLNIPFLNQKWSKFGMDIEDVFEACKLIMQFKNLKYEGLHAHLGTQITTLQPYKKIIKLMVNVSEEIYKNYDLETKIFDIGGGFPVRDLLPLKIKNVNIPKVEDIARVIGSTFKKRIKKSMKFPFLILEPGRIIVSSPIFLLLKVISVKTLNNIGKVVVVDGGLNILPEAEYFRYDIIPHLIRRGKREKIQIVGPLCMEEDVIGIDRTLPPIHEGDILVVLNAGGYSISLSWQFIKSRPAIILINSNKNIKLIRKAENFRDIFKLDLFT